ncbi:MAG TPA: hypothetical protein VFS75_01200 [Candidatus Paceibacterota bacterium]|nr:hypothetical protein [Candidatus Paceibacterota bacterium]
MKKGILCFMGTLALMIVAVLVWQPSKKSEPAPTVVRSSGCSEAGECSATLGWKDHSELYVTYQSGDKPIAVLNIQSGNLVLGEHAGRTEKLMAIAKKLALPQSSLAPAEEYMPGRHSRNIYTRITVPVAFGPKEFDAAMRALIK